MPQYQKAVEKARVTEALTLANSMRKAIDLYVLEKGFSGGDNAVWFFGPQNHEDLVSPDIEITKSLTCRIDNYGITPFCYKDRIAYVAYCGDDGACRIHIGDILPEWLDRDEYAAGDWENYYIEFIKDPFTGKWKTACDGPQYICSLAQ